MSTFNIHYAKTHFSQLIDVALEGKEVVISKAGKPLVVLISIEKRKRVRFGVLKGKIKIAKDFDVPLPKNVLSSFEKDR